MAENSILKYRPEVDGLRAIAVLLVVFFHAEFAGFDGGFVGVDIFFVISGYLITAIVLDEVRLNKFNLPEFYLRRIRRLLPPLLFVLLVSTVFALAWLTPFHLKDFGQGLVAAVAFSANILYWFESNYFSPAAELKPLLHTWSLGVEAQFYLLFPVVLVFLLRLKPRYLLGALLLLFIVSLCLQYLGLPKHYNARFYLLPARIWEFLLGAFAALCLYFNYSPKHPAANQILSLLGLCGICYPIFAFDGSAPLPVHYPLLPTFGTALLIVSATRGTIAHKLLTLSPLVGLGLVSYSLYLWHFPLISLFRHKINEAMPFTLMLTLCIASLILAVISWRWIERPFRNPRVISLRKFCTVSIFAAAILVVIGLTLHIKQGIANQAWLDFMQQQKDPALQWLDDPCFQPDEYYEGGFCHKGDTSVAATYAVIGDSHAYSIQRQLSQMFTAQGASFLLYTKPNCPSSMDFHDVQGLNCDVYINKVLKGLKQQKIKQVVLVSYWGYYLNPKAYRNNIRNFMALESELYSAGTTSPSDNAANRSQSVLNSYRELILHLNNNDIKVYALLPIPTQVENIVEKIAKSALSDQLVYPPPLAYNTYLKRNQHLLALFNSLAEEQKVHLLGNIDALCPFSQEYGMRMCLNNYQQQFLYKDMDHLADAGVALFLQDLELPVLQPKRD